MDRFSPHPHVVVLIVALLQIGLMAALCFYFNFFPKYSILRLAPWFINVVAVFCSPIAEIYIYRRMTEVTVVRDSGLLAIIFTQCVISIFLMVYSTRKAAH